MIKEEAGKKALFGSPESSLVVSDPEFASFFSSFAFSDVPKNVGIPENEAYLGILAALMAEGGQMTFDRMLEIAYTAGVTPLQVREMIYQGTAYLGIGRTLPYLEKFNALRGAAKPIEGTGTVSPNERTARGEDAQAEIFGEGMRGFASSGPEDVRHINTWLSANCFGDYYTRDGLDLRLREMCTFCYIAAQGGCEPQLTAHAGGNIRVGNSREYLIGLISALVPYIGYPRCLNALRCVNEAAEKLQTKTEGD